MFGVLLFFVVAIGVFSATYLTFVGSDSSSNNAAAPTAELATTTTGPKVAGPYRVITGVNVRQGPGTNYPSVGTIQTGHVVFITCTVDGQPVVGPRGPSTKWLKLIGFGPIGYITVQYVDIGSDLDAPGKIPVCAAG
ncbi:MAG: hypothetical protein QOF40_2084 [Actinomycetota bacterium]|nr:hypothetical protein [Actinomycetota bacterium]